MFQTKVKKYLGREVDQKRKIPSLIFNRILGFQALGSTPFSTREIDGKSESSVARLAQPRAAPRCYIWS
jgi:hypothetical protein